MTGHAVQIRDGAISDLPVLARLLEVLFSIEDDFAPDRDKQIRGLRLMIDGCGKHRAVKVAEIQGRVVGMCTVQALISTAEGSMAGIVEDLVVDDRWRHQGIGRLLLCAVESWAGLRGIHRLQLLADTGNAGALEFYRGMGWESTRLVCLRRRLTWEAGAAQGPGRVSAGQ